MLLLLLLILVVVQVLKRAFDFDKLRAFVKRPGGVPHRVRRHEGRGRALRHRHHIGMAWTYNSSTLPVLVS